MSFFGSERCFRKDGIWKAVELCLQYGARAPLWTHVDTIPNRHVDSPLQPKIKLVRIGLTSRKEKYVPVYTFQHGIVPECLHEQRGQATLRDWVHFLKPINGDAILALLDKRAIKDDIFIQGTGVVNASERGTIVPGESSGANLDDDLKENGGLEVSKLQST